MRLGLDLWCLPILPCLHRVTAAPSCTRGEVSGQLCLLIIHADKGSREIFLKVESRARQGNYTSTSSNNTTSTIYFWITAQLDKQFT